LRDPLVTWNGEGNGVIGKRAKVGWLVSRPGFRKEQNGERTWRGRKDAVVREGVKKTKRSPEGVLFTLATSNRTVAVDPLKNGFTTCCWQSHLKIPLDIERISEKEGDPFPRRYHACSSIPCKYKSSNIKKKTASIEESMKKRYLRL